MLVTIAIRTLEALFAGPISGASMNPARSLGPALAGGLWTDQWIYILGPMLGAVAGAFVYRWLREASRQTEALVPLERGQEAHQEENDYV